MDFLLGYRQFGKAAPGEQAVYDQADERAAGQVVAVARQSFNEIN